MNAQKKREMDAAALLGPQSQHPEAVSAWQRSSIVRRVDGDWAKYGFSNAERDLWVRFGIPVDHAPLAVVCNEVQDVPGFRITPDRLSMRLSDGTILDAVLRGMDSSRLEDRIASTLGRGPEDSPLAWRRAIYRSVVVPIKTPVEVAALKGRLSNPIGVPEFYEAILSWADVHGPVMGQRFQLQYQAHRYLHDARAQPGALLLSYARCFGIVAEGPEMRELATALRAPDNDARNYRAAAIYAANARNRYLYFVGAEAHEKILRRAREYPHPAQIDATRLPSTTGFIWLDSARELDAEWAAQIFAWHIDGSTLHVTLAPANRTFQELSGNSVKALSNRKVVSIPLGLDALAIPTHGVEVVAVLAAFLDVMEVLAIGGSNEMTMPSEIDLGHRVPGTPASITVLYPRDIAINAHESGTSIERTHQWTVRGHWRNQWRPSTKDHTRLWIKEHRAGPEDAPLMNRDRVRVVGSSLPGVGPSHPVVALSVGESGTPKTPAR